MSDVYNWLRVLELEPGVSFDEIKRAHRDMAKVWHPDRFGDDGRLRQKAEERQKAINEAFQNLERWVKSGQSLPAPSQFAAAGGSLDVAPRPVPPHIHKPDPRRDTWTMRPPLGFEKGFKRRRQRRHHTSRRWVAVVAVLVGVVAVTIAWMMF